MDKKLRLGQKFFMKSRFRRGKNNFMKQISPNLSLPKGGVEYFSPDPIEKKWQTWLLNRAPGFPPHNNDFAVISSQEEDQILFLNQRNFFYDYNLLEDVEEITKLLMKQTDFKKQKRSKEKEND